MSAPRPPSSPDAAHAQHDALLIAQQVTGDPLDPAQAREAVRLIATCRACAELAADLRAVAKAVAWEPVPPRRRDFRIDPVRADALRGSAWSRLLRRVAMPQGRALRPIAAGVMSLGLVLVVAGNAWPSAAPSTSTQPAVLTQASPASADEAVAGVSAPAAVPPSELMIEVPAPAQGPTDDQTTLTDAQAPDTGPDVLMEELYASEAKASQAPRRERDASLLERSDAVGSDAADTAAGAVGAVEAVAEDVNHAEPSVAAVALEAPVMEEPAPMEAEDALEVGPADDDAAGEGAANQELKATAAGATDGTSLDLDTIVIWVGVGLALLGALLLGLAWLSRRAGDPLLR